MSNHPRSRRGRREPTKSAVATYWNGEPTPARRVRVLVTAPPVPTWWYADIVGTERAAVLVSYGDRSYLLDDEDGSGWRKVTEGHGGPGWPHRGLDGCQVLDDVAAPAHATTVEQETELLAILSDVAPEKREDAWHLEDCTAYVDDYLTEHLMEQVDAELPWDFRPSDEEMCAAGCPYPRARALLRAIEAG